MTISRDKLFLKVKDHSVSQESFLLYHDEKLDLLYTDPQPEADDLPRYYHSDDYISHTDSKRSLFENAYHFVKNLALKRKVHLLNSLLKEKGSLLDIGAGTGDFLLAAQANGWTVSGTEPAEKARILTQKKGLLLSHNTSTLASKTYDVITMWHVFEHVTDVEKQIVELQRLLKPSGFLIVAVPNYKSFDAAYYGEFWAAYDVPRHLWHYSKSAIKVLFNKHNMDLVKLLPLKFDAFYVALLSEKYKSGKMNYFNAVRIGLQSNFKARRTGEFSSLIYIIRHHDVRDIS